MIKAMMGKQQAIDLFQEFAATRLENENWYTNIKPYIKAVILYGSIAKGTHRPDSDIDILIIVPLVVEEKFTAGEYTYTFKGQEINIVLRSIEKLRIIADEHNDTFQKEVFRGSCLISASDAEVSNLIRKIAEI